MSVYLELMEPRTVNLANYITFRNPALHPDRTMAEHDFLYMIDGTWQIEENGKSYPIESGDLLILPAGRHHYGQTLCSPNNRHMYIHVSTTAKELLENQKTANPDTAGLTVFDSVIHCQNQPSIKSLFEEIISISFDNSAYQQEKLSLMFSLLLCQLAEQQRKPAGETSKESIPEKVSHLLHSTPQQFFTAKELASRYYICERTLSNLFKKKYGKTFYAYQMDLKLEMVRQFLLAHPDITLRETALNFGFYDEFHLSKSFKKKFGISPSAYQGTTPGTHHLMQ